MELRDTLAMHAMDAICMDTTRGLTATQIAEQAYTIAEAMTRERTRRIPDVISVYSKLSSTINVTHPEKPHKVTVRAVLDGFEISVLDLSTNTTTRVITP